MPLNEVVSRGTQKPLILLPLQMSSIGPFGATGETQGSVRARLPINQATPRPVPPALMEGFCFLEN